MFLTFGELFFQWQELLARKPKEGEEDPVLVEEIRKARENVGMYTRKTSFEYEELDPIRFEKHKTFLVQLLTKVQQNTVSNTNWPLFRTKVFIFTKF